MMRKSKSIGAAAVGTFAAALLMAGTALAQTPPSGISPSTISQGEPGSNGQAIAVEIDTSGQTLVRGTLESVGAQGIALNSWGGTWDIVFTPQTQFIPAAPIQPQPGMQGPGAAQGAFLPGDVIGVLGTMEPSQNGTLTVEASLVHDWAATAGSGSANGGVSSTSGGSSGTDFFQGIGNVGAVGSNTPAEAASPSGESAASEGASAGKWGKLYTGTAASVGANSLTMQNGNTSYTVVTSPSTFILDNARNPIPFSDIQPGDFIRTDGTLTGSTITATVVRDTSR